MSDESRAIVIGSGPSGAMAARELVRQRVPVTMLESGSDRPRGALVRVNGRNVFRRTPAMRPDPPFVASDDPATRWYTHLEPGGMSNHWTGAVPRFAPQDFSEGARLDERYRWPVTYEDLVPFYAEAERVMHVTGSAGDLPALPEGELAHHRKVPAGWEPVARAARARGQSLTMLPLADGPPWLATRRATAFNSYSTIIEPLLDDPLFELRTNAHALQLEWDGADRRITGVVFHDRSTGAQARLPAAAVVVACGPLGSTKLLFDSACPDFPEGIGNTEGLLGRYLHDHPKEWWSFEIDDKLPRLAPAAYLTRRPYEDSPPLMATSWTLGLASPREKVLSLTPLPGNRFGVQVFGTMRPTEDRFVRPHPTEVDEFGLPQLEISIHFDDDELANIIGAREHLLSIMADAGHPARLDPVEPQLHPGHAVHYGGTARMHRCRQLGVLDEWNRPHDVPNLAVADASCFTTNSEKNPTLTAMALAARAARHLADELRTA